MSYPSCPSWCHSTARHRTPQLNDDTSVPGAILHLGGGSGSGGDLKLPLRPDPAWPENGPGSPVVSLVVQRVDQPSEAGDTLVALYLDGRRDFAMLTSDDAANLAAGLAWHAATAGGVPHDEANHAARKVIAAIDGAIGLHRWLAERQPAAGATERAAA